MPSTDEIHDASSYFPSQTHNSLNKFLLSKASQGVTVRNKQANKQSYLEQFNLKFFLDILRYLSTNGLRYILNKML